MSFFVLFILCLFVFNLNLTLMSIFLLLLVAFLVLLERKVLGLLQERKGPNMVSVFGLVQTIVDGVKLLVKYCYINYLSFYFLLLPIISLSLSYMHWLVLPLPFELFGSSFTIIFTFVVMGLMVYVILGCGFVSSSSYSIISAIRSVAQMISYEVVFMFYLLSLMLVLSSYSWKFIILLEDLGSTFIKFFFLLTWLVLSLSELNRTPFDLVEGESELVSGFNVEYSSFGFTLLFLSEYMNIWFMSILFMLLYNSSLTFMCFSVIFYVLLNLFIRGMLRNNPFHLVDQSPWPILSSLCVLQMALGLLVYMHMKSIFMLLLSLTFLIWVIYLWWRDVSRESSYLSFHISLVRTSLRLSMILFIVSEVCFFFGFFWTFFHSSLSVVPELGCWPPFSISTLDPMNVPLLNTVVLLSSSITVTYSHHNLISGEYSNSFVKLLFTLFLSFFFTFLQMMEYMDSSFNISDSVYGSIFFMATSFHSFHVLVSSIFLLVNLLRMMNSQLVSF